MDSSYISRHDLTGKMIECSNSVEIILGYKKEELYQLDNIYKIMHPDDRGRIYRDSHSLTRFNVPKIYWRGIKKNGEYINLLTYSTILNGEIIGITIKLNPFKSFIMNIKYIMGLK